MRVEIDKVSKSKLDIIKLFYGGSNKDNIDRGLDILLERYQPSDPPDSMICPICCESRLEGYPLAERGGERLAYRCPDCLSKLDIKILAFKSGVKKYEASSDL